MQIIDTVAKMREAVHADRKSGRSIGLVPTMGALHAGHLRLVESSQSRSDRTVVSIFVNPTQFGPEEDFDDYPRDLESDAASLEAMGVSYVFAPSATEMYPTGASEQRIFVEVDELNKTLCGRFRPGHFRGVATVVSKLLNIVRPDIACFGLKDAQQFVIIKRLISELHFDVEVVGVPTVREEDGLALSSRNVYLNEDERRQAVVLSRSVATARGLIMSGERSPEVIIESMREQIAEADLADAQYVEVVDALSLTPSGTFKADQEVLAAVAVYFGSTRLIDNAFVIVPA